MNDHDEYGACHGPSTTRRRLLAAAAATGLLSAVPGLSALAADDRSMRTRAIPSTGEPLPVMGLGSSGTFAYPDNAARAALLTVLKKFVAMGGAMVDTSPTYGSAETVIGELARRADVRNDIFMATKVHIRGRQAGLDQMAQSAARLGKPIDLMQIHNFVDLETQWQTLERLKGEGRFRYIGITHYLTRAFEELEHQMRTKDMDFVQFNYSILTPEAEKRLLPLARDRGIAVIVNRAFNDGAIFGRTKGHALPSYASELGIDSWAQFALKYVLANPAVNVVIPATSDPGHLVDNMQAGYGPLPDDKMQARMRATMAELS
ncbi:aldo/keto reductase [Salinisphaera sp. Q1T1-3]|uniref:aldo/keto reductase n=1 Tax=Salinisphaera sp. Q1T1-3 TaxID=2321229 RepID=UPI000E7608FF|nr:aldo/keto reductase [Salinisphaera sp. Q1T1-3]RJS94863.1 aldo/keto reductase [Salinisphaera sp. Q1T1-3]